jgi:ElaB/YqjD/DUF883 family membrane-anchored ribosome-binding protein
MSNQNSTRDNSPRDNAVSIAPKNSSGSSGDASSKASEMAQQAVETAKQAVSDTTSSVIQQTKGLMDHQVGNAADMVGHVAGSARCAADDLEKNAPQLAGLVRSLANRAEVYADDLRDQSADQLLRAASDFTRRQPAMVFGLAALAGFFVFRTIKSTSPVASPSIQPQQGGNRSHSGEYHGI